MEEMGPREGNQDPRNLANRLKYDASFKIEKEKEVGHGGQY